VDLKRRQGPLGAGEAIFERADDGKGEVGNWGRHYLSAYRDLLNSKKRPSRQAQMKVASIVIMGVFV